MNPYRRFFLGAGYIFVTVGIFRVIFRLSFKNHVLKGIDIWLGAGMVILAIIHVFQNWHPLKKHLGDWKIFILLLPILVLTGFLAFKEKETGQRISKRAEVCKFMPANASYVVKGFGNDESEVSRRRKAMDSMQPTLLRLFRKGLAITDSPRKRAWFVLPGKPRFFISLTVHPQTRWKH